VESETEPEISARQLYYKSLGVKDKL
jgi:hypothetical protein